MVGVCVQTWTARSVCVGMRLYTQSQPYTRTTHRQAETHTTHRQTETHTTHTHHTIPYRGAVGVEGGRKHPEAPTHPPTHMHTHTSQYMYNRYRTGAHTPIANASKHHIIPGGRSAWKGKDSSSSAGSAHRTAFRLCVCVLVNFVLLAINAISRHNQHNPAHTPHTHPTYNQPTQPTQPIYTTQSTDSQSNNATNAQ
jgi:hypothetical protein